jgi:hypothetical protein
VLEWGWIVPRRLGSALEQGLRGTTYRFPLGDLKEFARLAGRSPCPCRTTSRRAGTASTTTPSGNRVSCSIRNLGYISRACQDSILFHRDYCNSLERQWNCRENFYDLVRPDAKGDRERPATGSGDSGQQVRALPEAQEQRHGQAAGQRASEPRGPEVGPAPQDHQPRLPCRETQGNFHVDAAGASVPDVLAPINSDRRSYHFSLDTYFAENAACFCRVLKRADYKMGRVHGL